MFKRLRAFLKRICIQRRPEFKEKPKPYVDPVTAAKREWDVLIFRHKRLFDQVTGLDRHYVRHFFMEAMPLVQEMSEADKAQRRGLIADMHKIVARLEEIAPILNDAED